MNTGIEEVLSHLLHCGILFNLLDSFYTFGVEYLYHRLQKTDNSHWLDIDQSRLETLRQDGGLRLPRPITPIDSWVSGGLQDVLRASSVYWSKLLGRRSPSMGTNHSVDRFREPCTIAMCRAMTSRPARTEQSALSSQPPTAPSSSATIGNGVYWYLGGAAPVWGQVCPRGDEPLIPIVDLMVLLCNWTVPAPETGHLLVNEDSSMADPEPGPSQGSTLPATADQPVMVEDLALPSDSHSRDAPTGSSPSATLADQPALETMPLVADQPVSTSAEDENSLHALELPGADMEVEN